MYYPDWMTAEDIEEFEKEMAEITIQENELEINRELSELAQESE